MESDWEEVRRLAAHLQRVQLTDTAQRLSERCVVELIGRLLKERRLIVIHSRDGKELLTVHQLEKEISDEVYTHGGRVNLADLQQVLNVDVGHIETRALEMCRADKDLTLVLGQIIHSCYLDRLCEDLIDRLHQCGCVNVSDLCKLYDLPTDFLTEVLRSRLLAVPSIRGDSLDTGLVYTDAFVSRLRARVRGLFSAATRPTNIHNIISQFGFQERLFYTVLEQLVQSLRVRGTLLGGRRDGAVFVPLVYSRTQSAWIDDCLRLNGFLELDSLSRLGVADPDSWVRRRYSSPCLVRLPSAFVRESLLDGVYAAVDEALASESWVDVQPLLPSSFTAADVEAVLHSWERSRDPGGAGGSAGARGGARGGAGARPVLLCGRVLLASSLLDSCLDMFSESMRAHAAAQASVRTPALILSEQDLLSFTSSASTSSASTSSASTSSAAAEHVDERRRKAHDTNMRRGNAREVKTKRQRRPRGRNDSDDDAGAAPAPPPAYPPPEEVRLCLHRRFPEWDSELLTEIAEELARPLAQRYASLLASVAASPLCAGAGGDPEGTAGGGGPQGTAGGQRKQGPRDLQEELSGAVANIRLFLRGTVCFTEDVQLTLRRHLLRSLCSDAGDAVFSFLADEETASGVAGPLTGERRLKILGRIPEQLRRPLGKLHVTMAGKSVEDFLCSLEEAADACGLKLKKVDRKRERQLLFQHRQALLQQLAPCEDAALVLHLAVTLLFQQAKQAALHAPGRCVPSIVAQLHGLIPAEQHALLTRFQSLVKLLIGQERSPGSTEDRIHGPAGDGHSPATTAEDLQTLIPLLKAMVLKATKVVGSEA